MRRFVVCAVCDVVVDDDENSASSCHHSELSCREIKNVYYCCCCYCSWKRWEPKRPSFPRDWIDWNR